MNVRYRGTFEYCMDAKGRVAVPREMKEAFFGSGGDCAGQALVLTNGLSGQLFAFSREGFDDFARRYCALSCEDADLMDRFFGGSYCECLLDAQSRIVVPTKKKAFADLVKKVAWVGQRGHFELWSEQRWQEAESAVMEGEFLTSSAKLRDVYNRIDFNFP